MSQSRVVLSERLVALNSASSVLARGVNFVVLLWVYQYLLRRIPAQEFAILPLVTALMVFAPLFFSFFIGGIVRYMVDACAKGDFVEMRRISASIFIVMLAATLVMIPVGVIFAFQVEHVFNVAPHMVPDLRVMILLMLANFAYKTITVPFTTAYAVTQRYFEKNLLDVLGDLIRAALLLTLLLTLGPRVIWVVVATVIAESSMNTIMLVRSFRILPELRFEPRLFSASTARELTGFGLWTTLDRLGAVLHTHAATMVLNLYGTAVEVTAYHVGATFFRQLESTIKLAALPLQPAVTAMNALGDRTRLGNTVLRAGRYGLWVSMFLATPMIVYADVVVGLYLGPDYGVAAWVLVLFMVIFPFTQPTILLASAALATKQVRSYVVPALMFQSVGVVLMFVFADGLDLGAPGVTLALTVVAIVSHLGYFWRFCLRLTGRSFTEFATQTLLRGLAPAAAGACAWVALRLIMPPSGWTELFLQGVIGACVYLLVLIGACLDPRERGRVHSMWARLFS
ncbi:Membrane protein involved in the export of O-antigen and teichoic acid [Roseivivax marinus]|uniref:hypothetical protein n=1 Tax=Roseivivax marinus TaxID=1379903 RepID=UPI0008CDAB04|nr:hypothetical protein [Roseivivax marinus]SEK69377.1 Membrane protein involved in the export of O-antigen and teichoic acid [Roseivivax marinus]